MKGTEKQIKWAEEIKTKVTSTIDVMREYAKKTAPSEEALADANAKLDELIDNINACENAWNIINVYKDLREGDVRGLIAIWSTAYPMIDIANEEKLIHINYRR